MNTAALLSDEAVRFFLTRYIIPTELADVLGLGSLGGLGAIPGSEMKR